MNILKVAKEIEENGGKLYLVGGAVRDTLMKKDIKDRDYVVVGISKDKFEELFPDAIIRGKSFPVYDFLNCEFALARTEEKIDSGHKGFLINANENISIYEDLKRRDITINSIAQDVLTNEIIDPFNGTKDINNKVIRATSESFKEDPLRVYRVAMFASRFEFNVEEKTIQYMKSLKDNLKEISEERVFAEFRKALECEKPSIFFRILKQAQILDVHFKEIFDLIGAEQPAKYHPEGDAFEHTMIVLDNVAKITPKLEIRFSGLVHDLGKGVTPREKYPSHHEHDKAGVQLVENMCNRLKMPTSYKKCGKTAAKEHMRVWSFYEMRIGKKVDFLVNINKSMLGLEGLEIIANCDKNRGENIEKIQFSQLGKEMIKKINGDYIISLGYSPDKDYKLFNEMLRKERIKYLKTALY